MPSAMANPLAALINFVTGVFCFIFGPILFLVRERHSHPAARPDRRPPNPKFFPYYMQNCRGLWLKWTEWKPVGKPVGVVFLVGGLAEHTARYDSMALRFTAKGFIVFSMDHQGQGLSEGDRKHVERFADYVNDLRDFIKQRLAANGNELESLPRFILGHSMGGLITTHLVQRHPRAFNGVILSAPALVPDPKTATPFLKRVAKVLGDYLPKLGLDNLDSNFVSRSEQVVTLYQNDPAVPKNLLRARWAAEMLRAMDYVWTQRDRLTFPFLLLHGSEDRIVLLEGSERLMQEAPSTDKHFAVYEDAYHEFFCDEKYCERAYADVFGFIDTHMMRAQLSW